MKFRCAILDDYQNVALTIADWSSFEEVVEVVSYPEHFDGEDALVAAIGDCQIVVIMRERTPFRKVSIGKLVLAQPSKG